MKLLSELQIGEKAKVEDESITIGHGMAQKVRVE